MDGIGQEVRQAVRRLWRSPAFTLAALLTLALAIGANASVLRVSPTLGRWFTEQEGKPGAATVAVLSQRVVGPAIRR